ncbi:MAG: hypothetical protein M3P34_09020 [Actinomycetota bacterium]|nr:hypothetical protein [Actinomycetota bacterium]
MASEGAASSERADVEELLLEVLALAGKRGRAVDRRSSISGVERNPQRRLREVRASAATLPVPPKEHRSGR